MSDYDNTEDVAFASALSELADIRPDELLRLRSDVVRKIEQSTVPESELTLKLRAIDSVLSRNNPLVFGQSAGIAPTFLSSNQIAAPQQNQGTGMNLRGDGALKAQQIALHGDESETVTEQGDYSSEILDEALTPGDGDTEQDPPALVVAQATVNNVGDFGDDPDDGQDSIAEDGTISDPEPDDEERSAALASAEQAENTDPEETLGLSSEAAQEQAAVTSTPAAEIIDESPDDPAEASLATSAIQEDAPVAQPEATTPDLPAVVQTAPSEAPTEDSPANPDDFGSLDDPVDELDAPEDEVIYDDLDLPDDDSASTEAPIAGGEASTTGPSEPPVADEALVSQIADRNDNGVLSAKEEDKFEEIADTDASGEVTTSEALAFDLIDTNDNGKIGKKELKAFRKIDTDSSGSLTTSEATASRDALRAQVSNLTKQEKRTLDLADSYLAKYGTGSGGPVDVNDAAQALVSNNKTESSLKEKKKKK